MKRPRIARGAAASLLLLIVASCQIPLVLQDPNAPTNVPDWQTQGRFRGTQPTATELYDEGFDQAADPGAEPTLEELAAAGPPPGEGMPLESGFDEANPQGTKTDDPLYAWDGGVVESREPGGIAARPEPSTRVLEPSLEGRMHILELYQEVLDERDALQGEVDALRAALAASREHADGARETSVREQSRIEELEESRRKLLEENHTLLGRLTTAQVRRLETEKLLLETQIAWYDERAGKSRGNSPVSFAPDRVKNP